MKRFAESVGAAALISLGIVSGAGGHTFKQDPVGSSLSGGSAELASPTTTTKFRDRPERRTLFSSDTNGLVSSDDALDINGSVSVCGKRG